MSSGSNTLQWSLLVHNPSVSCVKPQLTHRRPNYSLHAVQLKSKFAAFYEFLFQDAKKEREILAFSVSLFVFQVNVL